LLGVSVLERTRGALPAARARLEEGLALPREALEAGDIAHLLRYLGYLLAYFGDYRRARALLEEGLALDRAWGDGLEVGRALMYLGWLSALEGDYPGECS
jgi:tetratricopeptide (TPR) repeat protein